MLLYDNLTDNQRKFFLQYLWNGMGDNLLAPPAFIFSKASEYHDFFSFSGGTESDRIWATKDFFHKCHDAVRKEPLYKRPFYYFISYTYYWFLQKGDALTWTYLLKPANTWPEFISNVIFYYNTRNTPIEPALIGAENII